MNRRRSNVNSRHSAKELLARVACAKLRTGAVHLDARRSARADAGRPGQKLGDAHKRGGDA